MSPASSASPVDPDRVASLTAAENERFSSSHPRSRELFERARAVMPGGVPMSWMVKWPGEFPVFVAEASGAHFRDVDGHDYVDLCLGDTGAMTGHSPAPTVATVREQVGRGITAMLPTEDSVVVAEELRRLFGLPLWQFTLSATDANRHVIRYARHVTGRRKIVVHDHCYHGSVDETFATMAADGSTVSRRGNIGPPVDPAETTWVVEFNDVDGLERALASGEIACVLVEPALTNVGIVLPEPGFHEALRELTRATGTLLAIDETHTLSCGPGGYTGAHGLEPDLLTVGKPIAGGVPLGAYGMSDAVAERVLAETDWDNADVGGIGGTLAGNPLSLAAARATLEQVLTEDAYVRMIELGGRFEEAVAGTIAAHDLPWQVTRLGCRSEYMFAPQRPRTGSEADAAIDHELDALMHLYMLNRGVLMTPFHMMALMSPATTEAEVDAHSAAFAEACTELTA